MGGATVSGAGPAELAAIAETVEDYFEGLYHSDRERLERAFHPDARIVGPDDGELKVMELPGFLDFAASRPSAAAAGDPRDMEIVAIDVAGGVATAKVIDSFIGRRFIDYLALVRGDDGWRIYTKLWHVERRLP